MPNDFCARQPIVLISLRLLQNPTGGIGGPALQSSPMESLSEYLIVSGSLRSKSRSRAMANFLSDCYQSRGITAQLIDLRELPLPFCDGESAYGHQSVATLSRAIAAARVIIIATPIYNFDASAALKNLIELTGDSWEDKIVGFLCAAGGAMSYMSIMSFANSLMLDFRCLIIPRIVYATSEDFSDGDLSSALVRERVRELAVASTQVRNR
jgi:FMN reductase